MIGGNDTSLPGPLSEGEEKLVFEVIQRVWPQSVLYEEPPEDGTRNIFIYRTLEVHQQVDALGIVPEVEGHTVYMMLNAHGAHFVVGDEGSPGEMLVRAINDALDRPRVDFGYPLRLDSPAMEEWMDALGGRYVVERLLQVRCPCGRSAPATLLKITVPPDQTFRTQWFRPPAHWFVALTGDLKCIDDGKAIEGPFVRCPECVQLSPPKTPRNDPQTV